MYSIQEATNGILNILQLPNQNKNFETAFSNRIENYIRQLKIPIQDSIIVYDDEIAKQLEEISQLEFPKVSYAIFSKLQKLITKKNEQKEISLAYLTYLVASLNYEELLIPSEIQSEYEVSVAVSGMTIQKIGLNPFEVSPEKYFVRDLGIDA
jgi:hypothetical protein